MGPPSWNVASGLQRKDKAKRVACWKVVMHSCPTFQWPDFNHIIALNCKGSWKCHVAGLSERRGNGLDHVPTGLWYNPLGHMPSPKRTLVSSSPEVPFCQFGVVPTKPFLCMTWICVSPRRHVEITLVFVCSFHKWYQPSGRTMPFHEWKCSPLLLTDHQSSKGWIPGGPFIPFCNWWTFVSLCSNPSQPNLSFINTGELNI